MKLINQSPTPRFLPRLGNLCLSLRGNRSGMALIEFAFTLPIFTGLGFYGIEISNLAI